MICTFLDSDIIILDKINNIDKTKELGVSPQFIQKNVDETGYYNGGMLGLKIKMFLIMDRIY